ncbi:ABC transporter permease subunit [Hymenobacter sp. 15J16-1T3B]|uniref:ABC transporter permease n=1 Tax=Hymenobacter sp. 15J16-1T3B TaxID=2886941 RepID=UPI001D1019E7|nr:ABC transporter permease subunit [Hymenobacter sp. 15J16-1T3B]MCC3159198.1 ABC transporter permease subunit [Hymenobacter sp. 15J16-1T3B]
MSRWLAGLWLLALLLAAAWAQFGPAAGQPAPLNLEQLSHPPSAQHWLGTDPYGRDVLTDLILGTRQLVIISLPAALLASALGAVLGAAAGYWGNTGVRLRTSAAVVLLIGIVGALVTEPAEAGWWLLAAAGLSACTYASFLPATTLALPLDWAVLGAAAWLGAVPRLVLVLSLVALHAPAGWWLVSILTLTCWPSTARLTRTLVQQLRQRPYVEAGRAAGYSTGRLLWVHLAPNVWPSLRNTLPLNLSICLGLQTTLGFLGIGLSPDQADWGLTLANARLEPGAWWLVLSGLLALTCTMAAIYHLLPASDAGLAHLPTASTAADVTNSQQISTSIEQ